MNEEQTRGEPGSEAPSRAVFGGLMLLCVVVRLLWLAQPVELLDHTYPDDTYIVMVLAREFAATGVPSFEGVLTNGFQPLFVLMLTGLLSITGLFNATDISGLDAAVKISLGLCALFHVLTLPVALSVMSRAAGKWGAILFGLMWAIHPTLLIQGTNGLETSLATLCLFGVFSMLQRHPIDAASTRMLVAHGVLLGVGILSRIDVVLIGVWYAYLSLAWLYRAPRSWRQWGIRNLSIVSPMLVTLAPWYVFSYVTTGELIPVSGAALVNISVVDSWSSSGVFAWNAHVVASSLPVLFGNAPLVMMLAILCAVVAVREGVFDAIKRALAPMLAFAFIAYVFYVGYVQGMHFFDRYLYVVTLASLAFVCAYIGRSEKPRVLACVAGALCVVTSMTPALEIVHYRSLWTLFSMDAERARVGFRSVGIWAREHVAQGETIGSTQTGAIAYYATDHVVVNLDGVVSRPALDALHAKRIDEYMDDRGVDVLMEWHDGPIASFLSPQSSRPIDPRGTDCKPIEVYSWYGRWCVMPWESRSK